MGMMPSLAKRADTDSTTAANASGETAWWPEGLAWAQDWAVLS